MSLARKVGTFAGWTVIGAVAGVLALITLPRIAGYVPYTVLTGSMSPAIAPGDIVIDERLPARHLRAGDIVTFADPERRGRMITHRVRRIDVRGSEVAVVTRGDANTVDERWRTRAAGHVGRVVARVPYAGFLTSWIRSPHGRLLLLVVPAVLLAVLELHATWRPARKELVA